MTFERIRYPVAILLTVALLGGCARQHWFAPPWYPTLEPMEQTSFGYHSAGLAALHEFVLETLGPGTLYTIEPHRFTPRSDTIPRALQWRRLAATLEQQRYRLFRVSPDSYEAIGALMRLNTIVLLAIIDYGLRPDAPLTRTDLLETPIHAREKYLEQTSLHPVLRSRYTEGRWVLHTSSGITLSGTPSQECIGQITHQSVSDAPSRYLQVAEICILSTMSQTSIEGHLDEWFSLMPADRVLPSLVPLP